jgi:hypothetical protein
MIGHIREEAMHRGITRLCHFTPSRNLIHIATGRMGILATKHLKDDERSVYTPTDLLRLDQHERYICCSIEYPNAWYLARAQGNEPLFRDWVIILISPRYLWMQGTRFCSRNAAAAYGRDIAEGEAAFMGLFADSVTGGGGRIYRRSHLHLPCCPTDQQAEILVPDRISSKDILGVVVADETQAKNELARFRLAGIKDSPFNLIVAPLLFDRYRLSNSILGGTRPTETLWIGEKRR